MVPTSESLFNFKNEKKMNTKIFYFSFLVAIVTVIGSCKKQLDINVDPTRPTKASVDLVLPSALGYTAYNMASPYQILGGIWGQFWTQGPTANQYNGYEQYVLQSTTFNLQWQSLYSGALTDFKYVADQGVALGRKNYAAIGKIMQAYVFQYLTDLHGDIPFTEALDPNNTKPVFDPQETVYNGLIKLVDEGLALIDEASSDHPGVDDIVYHGDMHLWKQFGNTLKLRIYLRQAYVRPAVAKAGIEAMYAAGAEFLTAGDDADIEFTTETFNQHPLYMTQNALSTANLLASNTALNYLLQNNDPRVDIFYQRATAAPNAGNYTGIDQGNGRLLTGVLDANMWSKPGRKVGGPATNGGDAPVILMSAAESYFLQAESVVRGWGTGNAQTLYNSGIGASFTYWGLTVQQLNNYRGQSAIAFPAAGTIEQKLDAVITQKWISMNGTQNVEAWTEWRRTGYPDMFTLSVVSNIGNSFPVRILYADTEVSRNPNTPAQKTVTDKVWWDVNTTGQN
jgi:hypothetical protein